MKIRLRVMKLGTGLLSFILATVLMVAGGKGCVDTRLENLLDPDNAGGWLIIIKSRACVFGVNEYNDGCIYRVF